MTEAGGCAQNLRETLRTIMAGWERKVRDILESFNVLHHEKCVFYVVDRNAQAQLKVPQRR